MRSPNDQSYPNAAWYHYNDTQTIAFQDWLSVIQECLNSKCMPTLLVYEESDGQFNSVIRGNNELFISSLKIEELQYQAID